MYGLVNRAIESMAIQAGGEECWNMIRTRAGFTDPMFLSMQAYPDEVTYNLVDAASETLNMPTEIILREFGRHCILFTAAEGYGALLDITGSDLKTFLSNLNHMHSQVASSMPDLKPPAFSVEEIDGGVLQVHYVTKRNDLSPMVIGLLEGLVEKFNVVADVVQTHFVDRGEDHDIFEIRPN